MSTTIDVGHGPGTSDPDGASSGWASERALCLDLGRLIASELSHIGTPCRLIAQGRYQDRHNGLPVDVAISLHADRQSSRTPYALALVHESDVASLDAAVCVLRSMGGLTSITRCIVGVWGSGHPEGTRLRPTETPGGCRIEYLAWSSKRGPVCISSYPEESARLLLEVGSLSHHEHREMLTTSDGKRSLSAAIARGIVDAH